MADTDHIQVQTPLMTSRNNNNENKIHPISEIENVEDTKTLPEDEEEERLEPPDGGWGWCVVLGSTLCLMLVGMQGPCFGIFYVKRLTEIGSSPTLATWLFNLQAFAWNFAGPWAGPLSQKYNHRSIAMVTALLSCSSFLMSAYVTNPSLLVFTFSFINGAGGGICLNCCFQMNAKYFKYRLGLANGIMMAGGSLGLMLIPQLASYLQEIYPFEWANLIAGAVMMNAVPGAMLFQPAEWHLVKRQSRSKDTDNVDDDVYDDTVEPDDFFPYTSSFIKPSMAPSMTRCSSRQRSSSKSKDISRGISVPQHLEDRHFQLSNTSLGYSLRRVNTMSDSPFHMRKYKPEIPKGLGDSGNPMSSKMAVFYLGGSTMMGSVLTLQHCNLEEEDEVSSMGDSIRDNTNTSFQMWLTKFVSYFQLSVLCDPLIISVALFTSITIPTGINIFTVIPFVMTDAGYSLQSAATAMTVNAMVDLVTRLVCASIIDQPWVNPRLLYGLAQMILFGVPLALIFGWHHWWVVMLCMAILGIGLGIVYTLDIYLIARLLGKEKIIVVFAISQIFRSMAFLALGPIGGALRVSSGSYVSVFVFYMGLIALAFFMMLSTFFCTRRQEESQTSSTA